MEKEELFRYMETPGELGELSLKELQLLEKEYPYFQTVRLLVLRNTYLLDRDNWQKKIEESGPFINNSRLLYELSFPLEVPQAHEGSRLTPGEDAALTQWPEEVAVDRAEHELHVADVESPEVDSGRGESADRHLKTSENGKADIPVPVGYEARPEVDAPDTDGLTVGHENLAAVPPVKRSLQENIAGMLDRQLESTDLLDLEEADFFPEVGLDIEKVYGTEDQNRSIEAQDVIFELEEGTSGNEPFPSEKPGSANDSLIEKFIAENPSIGPLSADFPHVDISEESVREHEGLFTETLARIYIKQGYYSKAIFAYEKLILKYPEKRLYFAAQINEIKKLSTNL